jgi:glycosyltransferase involved in cell wall biosynthesis
MSLYINSIKSEQSLKIELLIVGDGSEKNNLIQRVIDTGLTNNVIFTGALEGKELDLIFNDVHIGIGTLGSYRKKLFSSSTLKVREYAARGLPFILAEDDIDFSNNLEFVYRVPNNSSPINFFNIINWYSDLRQSQISSLEIRKYAELNLDYRVKSNFILSSI